jgi:hypothetical protein
VTPGPTADPLAGRTLFDERWSETVRGGTTRKETAQERRDTGET